MSFFCIFLGKSTAPTVAAADQVEECPSAVPESVYQTDPKTMHIEEAAVASGRGKGKMSGKRVFDNSMLCLYKYNIYTGVQPVLFFVFISSPMKSTY